MFVLLTRTYQMCRYLDYCDVNRLPAPLAEPLVRVAGSGVPQGATPPLCPHSSNIALCNLRPHTANFAPNYGAMCPWAILPQMSWVLSLRGSGHATAPAIGTRRRGNPLPVHAAKVRHVASSVQGSELVSSTSCSRGITTISLNNACVATRPRQSGMGMRGIGAMDNGQDGWLLGNGGLGRVRYMAPGSDSVDREGCGRGRNAASENGWSGARGRYTTYNGRSLRASFVCPRSRFAEHSFFISMVCNHMQLSLSLA